jgi:hypothetical protein
MGLVECLVIQAAKARQALCVESIFPYESSVTGDITREPGCIRRLVQFLRQSVILFIFSIIAIATSSPTDPLT